MIDIGLEGMQLTATPEQIGDVLSAFAVSKNNDVQRAISDTTASKPRESRQWWRYAYKCVRTKNELIFNNGSHGKGRRSSFWRQYMRDFGRANASSLLEALL